MEEIVLRNRFEKGQEVLYKSKTEIHNKARNKEKDKDIGTQDAAWEVEIRQRILELEGEDAAHVLYYSTPLTVPLEAQMLGVLNKKQVIYVLMNTRGKVLEASGIGFQGIVNFPEKPLKDGDTWTDVSEMELPGFPQSTKHNRTFKLAGIERVKDYDCVKLIATSEETELEVPTPDRSGKVKYVLKTNGEIYFAYKEGFLVRSTLDTAFTSTFGTTIMEGTNRFSQELLEVKAKVKA